MTATMAVPVLAAGVTGVTGSSEGPLVLLELGKGMRARP